MDGGPPPGRVRVCPQDSLFTTWSTLRSIVDPIVNEHHRWKPEPLGTSGRGPRDEGAVVRLCAADVARRGVRADARARRRGASAGRRPDAARDAQYAAVGAGLADRHRPGGRAEGDRVDRRRVAY